MFARPSPNTFEPSAYAAGPYQGVQGGAIAGIAGIAATVIENHAPPGLTPLSFHTQFLRPAPMETLTVEAQTVHVGRRLHRYAATVTASGQVLAHATMAMIRPQSIDELPPTLPPTQVPPATAIPYRRARRRHRWMMDAFDALVDTDNVHWFRWRLPLAPGATRFAHVLGPADWSHGLPVAAHPHQHPVQAWPNIDLAVHLARAPTHTSHHNWLGVAAHTRWDRSGAAFGHATLLDDAGEFAAVGMGVVLLTTPPPTAPPESPRPAT